MSHLGVKTPIFYTYFQVLEYLYNKYLENIYMFIYLCTRKQTECILSLEIHEIVTTENTDTIAVPTREHEYIKMKQFDLKIDLLQRKKH